MVYLLSTKHNNPKDFAFLFWGPNSSGYTYNVEEAGLYDQASADIGRGYNDVYLVEESILAPLKEKYVIDSYKLGSIVPNTAKNRKIIGISLKDLISKSTTWDDKCFMSIDDFRKRNRIIINIEDQIREWENV